MKRSYQDISSEHEDDECCAKCRDLFGTEEGLSAACSDYGFSHWSSKFELQVGAQRCKLCRLVWEQRSWRSTKVEGAIHTFARFKGPEQGVRSWPMPEIEYFDVKDSLAGPSPGRLVRLHPFAHESK